MKKLNLKICNRLLLYITGLLLFGSYSIDAQNIKWLRVCDLQSPFSETGAEYEGEFNPSGTTIMFNFYSWPAKYSIEQTTVRMRGLWMGCRNFDDPVEKKIKSVKVVGAGPKAAATPDVIFPTSIKLIGKTAHPVVTVDDQKATILEQYDQVDEYDPSLPCDRVVEIKFNTSMGISVTKKVMAFPSSRDGNYFIYDYVFKNTGIYDPEGNVKQQTLHDVWFYWHYRYGLGGVADIQGFNSTWANFASLWGTNTLYHSFGQNPANSEFSDNQGQPMRGFFCWQAPYSGTPRPSYDEDWGTPKMDENGILGTAKYVGGVTLYADKSAKDHTNDPLQPMTTWYFDPDNSIVTNTFPSQYDESYMGQRYFIMTEGHPTIQHDVAVGPGNYPQNWRAPNRNSLGNTAQGQGFGPYTLEPGDSVHIIFAEGVAGISWEKAREVGANWYQWRNGIAQPTLTNPDGSTTTDFNEYKRKWVVEACKDSLLKMFRTAVDNYKAGYNVPKPPAPPSEFSVIGGGDRIRLTWSNNAASDPHFGGYVIYRSQGNVLDWRTNYEKLAEINDPGVTVYDDITAKRGFDYYYYIQVKDDGKQVPGTVLYSSMFWTVTSVGALLGRPAITAPPAPPDNDSTHWKYFSVSGEWDSQVKYYANAIVSYSGRNYICIDSTEENSVQSPGIDRRHWQATQAVGSWASGNAYNAGDVVTFNGASFVTPFSISGGSMLDLVRVVPNPYDVRSRIFQFGDQYQYDRIAFYGLPPACKLRIFTERGDLVWEKEHTRPTGDEVWDSKTSSGQIIVSGVYILYVETPDGKSVIRKFVVIR